MEKLTNINSDDRHFVHPDTLVLTKRGPKKISSVTTGDRVANAGGNYATVEDVFKTEYGGNLVEIFGQRMHEHHEVLTITSGKPVRMIDAEFKRAADVKTGDKIVSIVPTDFTDLSDLTPDICRVYGSALAAAHRVDTNWICIQGSLSQRMRSLPNAKITADGVTFNPPFNMSLLFDNEGKKRFWSPFALLPDFKLDALIEGLGDVRQFESVDICQQLRTVFWRRRVAVEVQGTQIVALPGDTGEWIDDNKYARTVKDQSTITMFNGTLFDLQISGPDTFSHTYLSNLGINHNGGGKRNGSFAIYLEPWHADIFDFLDLKKQQGSEEMRARDLFYALWIPDLFMRRVEADGIWSLMDPAVSSGLADVFGDQFEDLYESYERDGKFSSQIKARELWNHIIVSQIETGTPYMLYKDSVNRKTNQANLGTIKSSNLCTEIMEYTSPDEIAVCNLSSVSLPAFVRPDSSYDFEGLHNIVKVITRNLNKIIDINYYPVVEAETSNKRHRPIGIGIQGLADVFCMLKYPFESSDAKKLNMEIAETMYHAALEASCEIAAEREADILEYKQLASIEEKTKEIKKQINHILKRTQFSQEELTRPACPGAYDSYFWNGGCPVSKGVLQYDMWNVKPSDRYDWEALKEKIEQHGVRNSLLMAPMPTASTSQIMGNMESFECYTSNIYSRRTMAGEFVVVNKHLLKDLIDLGLWSDDMKQQILARDGSVQDIEKIPKALRDVYKTVWEIKQRTVIDLAADRGAFTCQSQSMNLYVSTPTPAVISSMHFYAWRKGLKTSIYYLRCLVKAKTQQFTVDPKYAKQPVSHISKVDTAPSSPASSVAPSAEAVLACSLQNRENCDMCGS